MRRVRLDAATISADARARRRRTIDPDQLALALNGELDTVYAYSFIATNLSVDTPVRAVAVEGWYQARTARGTEPGSATRPGVATATEPSLARSPRQAASAFLIIRGGRPVVWADPHGNWLGRI